MLGTIDILTVDFIIIIIMIYVMSQNKLKCIVEYNHEKRLTINNNYIIQISSAIETLNITRTYLK